MFRGTLSVITRIIWSIKLPNQWTNGTVDVCRCLHNLTYCYLPKIIIISHFVPQLTLAKKITFDFGHYFRSWQIGLFLQRKLAKYQYHGQLCNNNSTLLFFIFHLKHLFDFELSCPGYRSHIFSELISFAMSQIFSLWEKIYRVCKLFIFTVYLLR